jgi:hypothetical protein
MFWISVSWCSSIYWFEKSLWASADILGLFCFSLASFSLMFILPHFLSMYCYSFTFWPPAHLTQVTI